MAYSITTNSDKMLIVTRNVARNREEEEQTASVSQEYQVKSGWHYYIQSTHYIYERLEVKAT